MTTRLYLTDAYLQTFDATVTSVSADDDGNPVVVLDQTAFYATGGGQPHDTGVLSWDGGSAQVTNVRGKGADVQHWIDGIEGDVPTEGTTVSGQLDWDRRHELMRTHTAMHILCGVIYNEWGKSVTGGNMEPLSGRMDFEFDPLPEGFAARVTDLVNAEIAADRPIEVTTLPRAEALADDDLIRTKVNLIPEAVSEIRVVNIVGLDKQADGGTHLGATGGVGTFEITKTESKGKGNKRVRIALN